MSSFTWSHVSYNVALRDGSQRNILLDVSGHMTETQLVAILGPTGSGKTCLLNALSNRVQISKRSNLYGTVTLNGIPSESFEFRSKIGFVIQDDCLFSYLTVLETLTISAYFHMPVGTSRAVIDDKVNNVIKELGLSKVVNTIIGSSSRRGVSGGERKRVAIGKELMSHPKILFLDEPTSNLDSFQAQSMMEGLKKLASSGRFVVTVIHQPRSSIFEMIDVLLLLSEGKVMYFGPASEAVDYFSSYGYSCPVHFNPGDFFLDLVSLDTRSTEQEKETRERINSLALNWKSRVDNKAQVFVEKEFERRTSHELVCEVGVSKDEIADDGADGVQSGDFYDLNSTDNLLRKLYIDIYAWFFSFYLLSWRANAEIYRNYGALIIRVATGLFFAVLLSLVYHDLAFSQRNIQDRIGILYFLMVNQSFGPLIGVLSVFPNEKRVVNTELNNLSYPTTAYFCSRFLAELPSQIAMTGVFSTIIYWSVNLNQLAERFFIFLVVVILVTLCSMAVGFAISAMSPTAVIANAFGPPILIIFLLFGGFYINTASLPSGSFWVTYLSYIKWGFQALVINEFSGESFDCGTTSQACERTGDMVISRLDFDTYPLSICIVSIVVILSGLLFIAMVALIKNQETFLRVEVYPR